MRRSFHTRQASREPIGFSLHRALLIVVLASLVAPFSARAAQQPAGMSEAQTEHFRITASGSDPASAANFAVAYGGALETAYRELTLIFPIDPPVELFTIFLLSDQAQFDDAAVRLGRIEIPGVTALAGVESTEIAIFQPSFARYSTLEAENQLRHALSHIVTSIASGGNLPQAFSEGIAQYVERPVTEKLVRIASIVQAAYAGPGLAQWFEFFREKPNIEPALAAAQSYAMVAYLIDESQLTKLRQLLIELRATPDFREAFRLAYSGLIEDAEKRWINDLPEWTSGAWRRNIVAAFDLAPARRALEQANFAAAKEALTPSAELFGQIGDTAQLAVVQELITQCDIGIQAESLMTQAQQALESFAYDRALNLVTQAKLQFDRLPEALRPAELIAQYEAMAQQGITAKSDLDSAVRLSHSWRDYADARGAARAAGVAFAALGDETNVALADAELDRLDQRQRRIVLLLIALGVLTFAWLGLWLWARGPSELDWR